MKILLADDSSTMRRIELTILKSLGHEDVVQADCGEDALKRLAEHPEVGLVILDWNMPLMNGLDCLKAIKGNPQTKHVPVIMITAEATPENIAEALKTGASSYLVKPFEAEKLREVIQKAVHKE